VDQEGVFPGPVPPPGWRDVLDGNETLRAVHSGVPRRRHDGRRDDGTLRMVWTARYLGVPVCTGQPGQSGQLFQGPGQDGGVQGATPECHGPAVGPGPSAPSGLGIRRPAAPGNDAGDVPALVTDRRHQTTKQPTPAGSAVNILFYQSHFSLQTIHSNI